MLAKWNETRVKSCGCRRNGNRCFMAAPWRLTKGAAPCAVQAARTVLNGGDEETYRKATRLVPTQPGFRRQVKRGVRCQKKTIPVTEQYTFIACGVPLEDGAASHISLYCHTYVVHLLHSFPQTACAAVSCQELLYAQAHASQ